MEFKIRKEEIKDYDQVHAVLCAAFPSDAESKLVSALRTNGKANISLVAVNGNHVLGHVLFSPVTTTPSSESKGLGLAPVAVRPDVQSQGIGSQLIREGLQVCKEMDVDYCVVLGDPAYYSRFGFEKATRFDLQNEYEVDDEFMLIRFSNRPITGLIRYAVEFSMFAV